MQEGDSPCPTLHRGVLQGAVLSPALVNIFLLGITSGLPETVQISIHGDICTWSTKTLRSIGLRLQKLNSISHHLQFCGLRLATRKCAAIALTRKHTANYTVPVKGNRIPFVRDHTFLGVTLDRLLSWTLHVQRLKCKPCGFVQVTTKNSGTKWAVEFLLP